VFTGFENATVVKRGMCKYDNSKEYEVRIIEWHVMYGTGDYEDPIEVCDDRNIECYYVFFENLIKRGEFNVGGGGFLTIEEATASVESKVTVEWKTNQNCTVENRYERNF